MKLLNLVISSLLVCNILIGQGIYPNQLAPAPDSNMILKSKGNLLNAFDYEYINAGSGVNPIDSTILQSGYGIYTYEVSPNNWVVEADTNELVTQYDLTQIPDNDTQDLSIDSLNRVFTISLENGGNVKFKDSNPTDSTTVVNSYGTIITESPANQFNIKVDSSKFATPYDLSLMELDSFYLKTSGQLRIKQKGFATKYVNSLIYGGSSMGTNYLPIFSGGQSITNSSGTGFVKVTGGNVSYDNNTYISGTTGSLTENITGLQFDNNRQVIGGAATLSLSTGYYIPNRWWSSQDSVKTTLTGLLKSTSGKLSTAIAGTDYQAPLTNPVTGTGSANTLAIWNSSNTLTYNANIATSGNSIIADGLKTSYIQHGNSWSDGTTLGIRNGGTTYINFNPNGTSFNMPFGVNTDATITNLFQVKAVYTDAAGLYAGQFKKADGTNICSFETTGNVFVGNKLVTPYFQLTSGASSGKVLTSDASGNATWQLPSSESDPIFASDSNKIVHFADTLVNIASQYDLDWQRSGSGIYPKSNNYYVGIGGVPNSSYKLTVTGKMSVSDRTGTAITGAGFNGSGQLVETTLGDLTENIAGLQFNNNRQVIGGAATLSLSTGYYIPNRWWSSQDSVKTTLTGLLKSTSGKLSAAIAGTDYQAPLTNPVTGIGSANTLAIWNSSNTLTYNANISTSGNSIIADGLKTSYIQHGNSWADGTTLGIRNGGTTYINFKPNGTSFNMPFGVNTDATITNLFQVKAVYTDAASLYAGQFKKADGSNICSFETTGNVFVGNKLVTPYFQLTSGASGYNKLIYANSSGDLTTSSGTGYVKGTGTSFTYDNSTFQTTTLADGQIWIGNGAPPTSVAQARTMSGDATISNTGVVTVGDDTHTHTASTIIPDIVSSVEGVANDGSNIDLVGDGISITGDDANNKIDIAFDQIFLRAYATDTTACASAWRKIEYNSESYDNGGFITNSGGNYSIQVPSVGVYEIETKTKYTMSTVGGEQLIESRILINGSVVSNDSNSSYLITANNDNEIKYDKTIIRITNTSHLISVEVKNQTNNSKIIQVQDYPNIFIKKISN